MVKINVAYITGLLRYLDDGNWHTAKQIESLTGIRARMVRLIAEETGTLLGGQHGYKRVDMASADEINHTINALRSRCAAMTERVFKLEACLPS